MVKDVSISESLNLIESNKNNKDFIIIDCRTLREFQVGNIEGSINLDFYSPDFSSIKGLSPITAFA